MEDNLLISTKEVADLVRVESGTVRRAYCVDGHYLGLKPIKLPNKRLLWDKNEVNKLVNPKAE